MLYIGLVKGLRSNNNGYQTASIRTDNRSLRKENITMHTTLFIHNGGKRKK